MPTGVYIRSEETKRKMSLSRKGKPFPGGKREPWNKGKTGVQKNHGGGFKKGEAGYWTGKKRPNLVNTNAAKTMFTSNTKAFQDRKHTEKTKKEMRLKKLGSIPWNKDKELPQFSGNNHPMFGKHHTEKTKAKILESLKKRYSTGEPTSIEKKVYEELKARGLLFEKQKIINNKFIVDAYIPSLNLVIEADGEYWHGLPQNIVRDKYKDEYLRRLGFTIIRLKESEINDNSFKDKLII